MFYHTHGVNEDVHSLILCLYVCEGVCVFSNYVSVTAFWPLKYPYTVYPLLFCFPTDLC